MKRPALLAGLIAALLFLPSAGRWRDASAQPMMPDPSQMSGIPRQDPAVPAGTVTVRLIRAELTNRLPGVEVQLIDRAPPAGKEAEPRKAPTDAEGRATFATLPPSTYVARAVFENETLISQPIEVAAAPAPGMRVMLVFSKSVEEQQQELGTPDGKARTDLKQPAGVLVVRVVDENRSAAADLQVGLIRAEVGTEKIEQMPQQKTNAEGTARFEGLSSGPGFAYLVVVLRDGNEVRSQPFRLASDHGSTLGLVAQPTARGASAVDRLQIGLGSHIIFETQDDSVSVLEILRLQNPLGTAVDPGPQGVRIPLAEGALSAQLPQGSPSNLSIDSAKEGAPDVLWKGPIPPGETMIQVGFLLRHHGEINFHQTAGLPLAGLRAVVEELPGVELVGLTSLDHQVWQGKRLIFGTAAPVARGGALTFSLTGLPAEQMVVRWLAAALALAIAAAFTYLAIWGRPAIRTLAEQRRTLLDRRDALLAELLKLDEKAAARGEAPTKDDGKRAALLGDLEQVYRGLDELSSGPARDAG